MKLKALIVVAALVAALVAPAFACPLPTPKPTATPVATMTPPLVVNNNPTNTNTNTNSNSNTNNNSNSNTNKNDNTNTNTACSGIANCSPTAIANGGNANQNQHQNQGQNQGQLQGQTQSASANNALNNQISTSLNSINNYAPTVTGPAIGDCSNGAITAGGYSNTGNSFGAYASQGVQLGLSIPIGPKPISCARSPLDQAALVLKCADLLTAGIVMDATFLTAFPELKPCTKVKVSK